MCWGLLCAGSALGDGGAPPTSEHDTALWGMEEHPQWARHTALSDGGEPPVSKTHHTRWWRNTTHQWARRTTLGNGGTPPVSKAPHLFWFPIFLGRYSKHNEHNVLRPVGSLELRGIYTNSYLPMQMLAQSLPGTFATSFSKLGIIQSCSK